MPTLPQPDNDDTMMSNFVLPDDVEFGEIYFKTHRAPYDHPPYEFTTCEWVGDSRYLLVSYDMLVEMIINDHEIIEYPLGGIVEGVVFFVGQYHLQILGYSESHTAYIIERLN